MITLLFIAATCDPRMLVQAEQIHCSYTQVKKSKLFKKEMASKGELWVQKGDLRFDTFVVKGGVAKMKSGDRVETLPIDKLPKVSAFLGAFSGLFVGKLGELQNDFDLSCAASTMTLTPRSDTFGFLTRIELTVADGKLKTMLLAEKNGDTSTITLDRCDANVNARDFELR